MKIRLDLMLVQKKLATSRSQAENLIKLGQVSVDGLEVKKPGFVVGDTDRVEVLTESRFVSRAGLKLQSVVLELKIDFRNKVVLDVGSSTGGFTDYALQNGASRVIAVDVGTNQLHSKLRSNVKIDLYEKTDIRNVVVSGDEKTKSGSVVLSVTPDIILIDVSFISLREVLPHIVKNIAGKNTLIVVMVKPQFEAGREQINKGIIKNESVRRKILHDFELWARQYFVAINKRDSGVAGAKGNRERFYLLKKV